MKTESSYAMTLTLPTISLIKLSNFSGYILFFCCQESDGQICNPLSLKCSCERGFTALLQEDTLVCAAEIWTDVSLVTVVTLYTEIVSLSDSCVSKS